MSISMMQMWTEEDNSLYVRTPEGQIKRIALFTNEANRRFFEDLLGAVKHTL